jgi:hypothetical protein
MLAREIEEVGACWGINVDGHDLVKFKPEVVKKKTGKRRRQKTC